MDNDRWTLESLKEYFEKQFELRDRADETANLRLDHRLEGMNQLREQIANERGDYVTNTEHDQLRADLEAIRRDHVQRREFEEIKNQSNEGRGRRTALTAAVSVIVAIFAITFGVLFNNQLSASDVRAQIQVESPWATDKPQIEKQLSTLQQNDVIQKSHLAQIDTLDKFFCDSQSSGCP